MTDEELLRRLEHRLFDTMLEGCLIDDHLGRNHYDVGAWVVRMRVDELSRLIDMARKGQDTTPPAAQPTVPLPYEQVWKAIRPLCSTDQVCRALVHTSMDEYRAIEAAHGITHLQAVLNKARTHAEQQAADTAARDWLISIGSAPT